MLCCLSEAFHRLVMDNSVFSQFFKLFSMTFLLCWAATTEETTEMEKWHAAKVTETHMTHLSGYHICIYLLQEMDLL